MGESQGREEESSTVKAKQAKQQTEQNGGRRRRRGQIGQIARAGAGQGGEERRIRGRHAHGRAGQGQTG
jgi:hypothetical protein